MNSQFLDKFKGKTNKVPKQGVVNLIEATRKRPLKPTQPKQTDAIHVSSEKQTKHKRKKQKHTLQQKQNRRLQHVSQSANQLKRTKQKPILKPREILSLKQNKKTLEIDINVKKQPLKLPKISKENTIHYLKSGRQNSLQTPKQQHKDQQHVNIKPTHNQCPGEKLKQSIVTKTKDPKIQKSKPTSHGFESMLDEQALIQLKKLNDFQVIVHQMSIRRKYQQQQEELLQKSRHFRKGVTVHY